MIQTRPLTPDTFAPFGHVARPGLGAVKTIRDGAVRLSKSETRFRTLPEAAEPALDFYEVAPDASGPMGRKARRWPLSPGRRTW